MKLISWQDIRITIREEELTFFLRVAVCARDVGAVWPNKGREQLVEIADLFGSKHDPRRSISHRHTAAFSVHVVDLCRGVSATYPVCVNKHLLLLGKEFLDSRHALQDLNILMRVEIAPKLLLFCLTAQRL